jgi:hypothetical protein
MLTAQGVIYSLSQQLHGVEVTLVQYNKMLVYIYVPIVFRKMGGTALGEQQ